MVFPTEKKHSAKNAPYTFQLLVNLKYTAKTNILKIDVGIAHIRTIIGG